MNHAVLIAGGNLGDRLGNLIQAQQLIKQYVGQIAYTSSIYESVPWGFQSRYNFLNIVLIVETLLNAYDLLTKLQTIESILGRKRRKLNNYISRTMDIDILYFNNDTINTPTLQIPHPHIQERKFVLVPLCELMPDRIHATLQKSTTQLLEACKDEGEIHLFQINGA